MSKRTEAESLIVSHVLWASGAGLIPVPLVDFAAVTAIQIDMLQQLSVLFGQDSNKNAGRTFITALTGSTLGRVGASLFKAIPVIGTVLGGLTQSAMSGASTYAVGQVTLGLLESGVHLDKADMRRAREDYDQALDRGKEVVSELKSRGDGSEQIFQKLEKLAELKERGILTEDEFDEQKAGLLKKLSA